MSRFETDLILSVMLLRNERKIREITNEQIVINIDRCIAELKDIGKLMNLHLTNEGVKVKDQVECLDECIDSLWFKICIVFALNGKHPNIVFKKEDLSVNLEILLRNNFESNETSSEFKLTLFFLHRLNYIFQFKNKFKDLSPYELFYLTPIDKENSDNNIDYASFQDTFFDNFDEKINYEDLPFNKDHYSAIFEILNDNEYKYKISRLLEQLKECENKIKDLINFTPSEQVDYNSLIEVIYCVNTLNKAMRTNDINLRNKYKIHVVTKIDDLLKSTKIEKLKNNLEEIKLYIQQYKIQRSISSVK